MSQLEVDKIIPQSGTTLTIGDSGDTINFADGQNINIDSNTLYIDSTNNRVGIANASPSVALDVTGAAKVSGDLTVDTSTLHVDSTNNRVGVGTVTPSSKFEVSGGATINYNMRNTLLDNNGEIVSFQWDNNADFTIQGRDSNAGFKANWYRITSTATDGFADEHIWYTGSSAEAMRIDSSGNVGIGTSSPNEKLDSRGSAVFSGDHATATNAYGTAHGILLSSTSNLGKITAVSNGSNDVKLELRGLDGGTANSNQLVLDGGTSNVGIGTSSPDSRLEVLDSSATGIISRSTSTQATDTNKALRVRNNSDTDTFAVSYKGSVFLGSGTGIYFDGSTSGSNQLDDYEEGTWTPSWSFETSGSAVSSAYFGSYIKIGNIVHVSGGLLTSSISSPTGNAVVLGLPFQATTASNRDFAGSLTQVRRFASNMSDLRVEASGATSSLRFYDNTTSANNFGQLQGSDFNSGAGQNIVFFNVAYETD